MEKTNDELPVSFADVRNAAEILKPVVNKTPVMSSRTVNRQTDTETYLKCENFQRTGAFKIRGAYNALFRLPTEDKDRGVLTYSSGNHAQAVALAGQLLDIDATIIMPEDAPQVKLDATEGYGAEIITYDRDEIARENLAKQVSEERGLTLIPPYDHPHVVAGQGTTALEFTADIKKLDALLVCCGGGGLLSGCVLAANQIQPECKVYGVEPAHADDAARSFQSGTLQTVENPDTIADGARTPSLGKVTFPIVLDRVHDMLTVSEEAIIQAMHLLWQRMKIIVEPTGALGMAALYSHTDRFRGKRVGVVISGGNVDLQRGAALFEQLET